MSQKDELKLKEVQRWAARRSRDMEILPYYERVACLAWKGESWEGSDSSSPAWCVPLAIFPSCHLSWRIIMLNLICFQIGFRFPLFLSCLFPCRLLLNQIIVVLEQHMLFTKQFLLLCSIVSYITAVIAVWGSPSPAFKTCVAINFSPCLMSWASKDPFFLTFVFIACR